MADIPNDFPWRPGMNAIGEGPEGKRALRLHGIERHPTGLGLRGGAFDWRITSFGRWRELYGGDQIGQLMFSVSPQPDDAATIGALLGAVREAYKDPTITVHRLPRMWQVRALVVHDDRQYSYSIRGEDETEFAALLAAWNNRPVTR